MPVTRRRRANPPDQPEDNNDHLAEQPEQTMEESVPAEQGSESVAEPDKDAAAEAIRQEQKQAAQAHPQEEASSPLASTFLSSVSTNGERTGGSNIGRHDYNQTIEGGRRTSRGELFRRPPQIPVALPSAQPVASSAMSQPGHLQPPSFEIRLPLGNKPGDATGDPLHLAYNPGYTGADEVRSALLRKLAAESKHGGRGRCWGCGSLAVAYECWNTRNKTFGEIGVAYCEICGVWSVM
jgi:hypothetical protein